MPEAGIHYVGEVGTVIQVETEKDLTDATVFEVHIRKADDLVVEKSATKVDGVTTKSVLEITQDLDVAGVWTVHAYVEFATPWEGLGKADTFEVFEKWAKPD